MPMVVQEANRFTATSVSLGIEVYQHCRTSWTGLSVIIGGASCTPTAGGSGAGVGAGGPGGGGIGIGMLLSPQEEANTSASRQGRIIIDLRFCLAGAMLHETPGKKHGESIGMKSFD